MKNKNAFDFRIIKTASGAEVIDKTLSTPYQALDAFRMLEYIETASALFEMDIETKKELRKQRKNAKWYIKAAAAIGLL